MTSRKRAPRFVVILDRTGARHGVADVARAAIRGGADAIQIREKDLGADEVARILESVIAATNNPDKVVVNGFPELAAQFSTHLHLPEAFVFDRASVRLAPFACVSRSIHGPLTDPKVDYAILGNICATGSKPGKPGIGLPALAQIAARSAHPVLAIGGITPTNVRSMLESGAHGVAVRSYVIGSDDPERAAQEIKREIDRWKS